MVMPERSFSSAPYNFSFQGQMKSDEIKGSSNLYNALYWEYDPRLTRRWNIDPVIKPFESSYACFGNNSILYTDPLGDDVPKRLSLAQRTKNWIKGNEYKNKANKFAIDNNIDESAIFNGTNDISIQYNYRTERVGIPGSQMQGALVFDETTFNRGGIVSNYVDVYSGFWNGGWDGLKQTGQFLYGLGTFDNNAWSGLGEGLQAMAESSNPYSISGAVNRMQMGMAVTNYIQNVPNMSAYDIGYDIGFGAEKVGEIWLTHKVMPISKASLGLPVLGRGTAVSASPYTTRMSLMMYNSMGKSSARLWTPLAGWGRSISRDWAITIH